MLRKNNRRNYMRTESPKKTRKKICKKRCSEKNTLKKRYENRCSEQQQKKKRWEEMLRKKLRKNYRRTGARATKNTDKTIWEHMLWKNQDKILDIMQQPAAILVLPVLYTIVHNFTVSAILEDTGHCQIWVLQILEDPGKYWLYQYCRYLKILENTGHTSIVDTGRIGTKLPIVLVYCFFLSCLCVFYERTDNV
jgi:hypothetical protein